MIDAVGDGLVLAAGGNGGSAKSSDALGRLAAVLALDGAWLEGPSREAFRAA